MTGPFDDKDVGKAVVTVEGVTIGTVGKVDTETLYVRPEESLGEHERQRLGWVDKERQLFPLYPDAIETVTGTEIRLRPSFSGDALDEPPAPGE